MSFTALPNDILEQVNGGAGGDNPNGAFEKYCSYCKRNVLIETYANNKPVCPVCRQWAYIEAKH